VSYLSDLWKKIIKPIRKVIGTVVSWLTGIEEPDVNDYQSGVLLNKQSNVEPLPVIYGERKIGGVRVFVSTSGSNNTYLYVILALCEGPIYAIDNVYINDVLSTDSRFSGKVSITKYLGGDDQTADSTFIAANIGWTSDHRLRGVAYLAMRFTYDQDVFGSGVPTVTAIVRGRTVYDPRSDTTGYSDNPALCLRDYLTNTRYGKGLDTSTIDDTSFGDAADKCEELVSKYTGASGTEPIFTCNAVLNTANNLFENTKVLLSGMRGIMPYSNGTYGLIIEDDYADSFDFNIDNIIGGISITSTGKSNKYNRVTAKFTNPNANWQLDTITWPEADSADYSTFLSEDNDIELTTEINLPTITDIYAARDIARVVCLTSRLANLAVTFTATSEALNCSVGDIVTLTHATPGWTDKEFSVISLQLLDTGEVSVVLQEHDATIYPWVTEAEASPVQQSTLPNPFNVAPPTNLTATETTTIANDGTLLPSLRLNWTASADSFVTRYEIQWLGSAVEDYGAISESYDENEEWGLITEAVSNVEDYELITSSIPSDNPYYSSAFVTTTQYTIPGIVPDQVYNIKVRGINEFNVRSAWVSITGIAVGDTTAPGLPTSLTAAGGLKEITISWVRPIDNDFHYVEIYENTTNNFNTASKIAVSTNDHYIRTGLGYDVTRYYWLKSVDYSENVSTNTSSVNATTLFVDTDAFSESVNDLFVEAGAYGIQPVDSLPASGDFDGQIVFLKSDQTLYVWIAATSEWSEDIYTSPVVAGGSITAASFASGIEPVSIVSSLPSPSGYTGPNIVFLTTDLKLYRYDAGTSAWTSVVDTGDLDGELSASVFPTTLRPIEYVSTLPSTGNFEGRVAYLSTDDKLYRYTGTAWTTAVSTVDLTGQITSGQIADTAITEVKIANAAITNAKIAVDAVQGDVIATGAITETKITDSAITSAKISAGAVIAGKIATNAITATNIQSSAITTDKLAASAVTSDKITSGAITTAKLDAGAVTSDKITALAVTSEKINSGAITTAKLDAGAVTTDKITAGSISASLIATGAISTDKLEANAVTAAKIAASTITANELAANSVTSDQLAANSIIAGKIAAGAISTDALGANVVTTAKLAANSVTAGIIAASGVITNSAQINDGLITNAKIVNGAITNAKIENGAITNAKISDAAITYAKIGTGEVDTLTIAGNAVTVPTGVSSSGGISIGYTTSETLSFWTAIDGGGVYVNYGSNYPAYVSVVLTINFVAVSAGGNNQIDLELTANGVRFGRVGASLTSGFSTTITTGGLISGASSLTIRAYARRYYSTTTYNTGNGTFIMLGVKR